MLIEETHVNATDGYLLGEPTRIALEDTWMGEDATRGEIFRAMRSEYGRCASKVYVDGPTGPHAVGWVFVKSERYEDSSETYLHETWVTLLERHETIIDQEYVS